MVLGHPWKGHSTPEGVVTQAENRLLLYVLLVEARKQDPYWNTDKQNQNYKEVYAKGPRKMRNWVTKIMSL